jgi:hypothetical protein
MPDMGGIERGQRNVGVVSPNRAVQALGMSLIELFAEVERLEERDSGS